jgi:transposase-like protein
MDKQLRKWVKQQMREMDNGTLDSDKAEKMLDLIEKSQGVARQEFAKILDEIQQEKIRRYSSI